MPHAKLTITIPQGVWIGDISRAHPDVPIRILAALTGEDAGVGLVEISSPTVEELVADMRTSDSVTKFELLQRTADTVLLQFETTMPLLLLPIQDSGVPLTMPFTIKDGTAEWEITAPQGRLSALGTQLAEFGIPFTVNEVHQHIEPEQLLTDRQLRLVRTAVDHGYYDTPRQSSLTDLAEEVDLAKSTMSETLHRAEEQIIKQYLDNRQDDSFEQTAH